MLFKASLLYTIVMPCGVVGNTQVSETCIAGSNPAGAAKFGILIRPALVRYR